MLTRPGRLSDAALAQALDAGWAITPAMMQYRPVGYGSHHWQVTAGRDLRWFVTVDDLTARLRSSTDSLSPTPAISSRSAHGGCSSTGTPC
jgi:hypothetical protein